MFFESVVNDVLVGLHHVGAEDLLVAAFRHVGSGRSSVAFEQVRAASLRRKRKPVRPVRATILLVNDVRAKLKIILWVRQVFSKNASSSAHTDEC